MCMNIGMEIQFRPVAIKIWWPWMSAIFSMSCTCSELSVLTAGSSTAHLFVPDPMCVDPGSTPTAARGGKLSLEETSALSVSSSSVPSKAGWGSAWQGGGQHGRAGVSMAGWGSAMPAAFHLLHANSSSRDQGLQVL